MKKEPLSAVLFQGMLCIAHRVNCRELEAVWASRMAMTATLPKLAAPQSVFMIDECISILFRQSIRMSLLAALGQGGLLVPGCLAPIPNWEAPE